MRSKDSFLARKVFVNLLNLLGLNAKVEDEEKNGLVVLLISSNEAGRLIGKSGSNLNSLNLIMSRMLTTYRKNFPKIVLNIKDDLPDFTTSLNNRKKKIIKEEKNNVFNVYVEPGKIVQEVIESEKDKKSQDNNKKVDNLEKECSNALKELKRWGEDILIPPMSEEDCKKMIEFFSQHKNIMAVIDEKKSFSDRKRIRISLKKS